MRREEDLWSKFYFLKAPKNCQMDDREGFQITDKHFRLRLLRC